MWETQISSCSHSPSTAEKQKDDNDPAAVTISVATAVVAANTVAPHAQRRMMIQRILHPQEPFPKESPHPLSHPQPLLQPQLPHPQPDLSSPQPQFVAAKSLMLLPPENVYSSSYGGDRGCVTKQLTEKRNLAIIN